MNRENRFRDLCFQADHLPENGFFDSLNNRQRFFRKQARINASSFLSFAFRVTGWVGSSVEPLELLELVVC